MRTDGNLKLSCQQHDGEQLIDASHSTRVDLAKLHASTLQELLEHDPIGNRFTGRHSNRRDGFGDGRMSQDIVGGRRLLDPERIEPGQFLHLGDCLGNIPDLIGIHHQVTVLADLFSNQRGASNVVLKVRSHLHFEMFESRSEVLLTELSAIFIRVAHPARAGCVGGHADLQQLPFTLQLGRLARTQ